MMKRVITNKYQIGDRDVRPWGTWEVLAAGGGFVIKLITVNPGAKLSLQWHHHRGEHWNILTGMGVMTLGKDLITVKAGSSFFIPKKVHHRIENYGTEILKFIETQVGDILDENDIERLEDMYGRMF